MKPVALVNLILIAILTLYFVFKIIKITAKYIQIRKHKKANSAYLSSDEEDDKDQRILIMNNRRRSQD